MESDNQTENSKPWLWRKGQSGNPMGRPKGKTAKERAKEYLATMTDDEFEDFLSGMDKKVIWEMAEGKARQETDITSAGQPIIQVAEAIVKKQSDTPPLTE